MERISIYTWSYVYNSLKGKSVRRAITTKTKSCPTTVATFAPEPASWANPPIAPPVYNTCRDSDPYKYGTPRKLFVGDAGWNPI